MTAAMSSAWRRLTTSLTRDRGTWCSFTCATSLPSIGACASNRGLSVIPAAPPFPPPRSPHSKFYEPGQSHNLLL
jgi:hypothetical protein